MSKFKTLDDVDLAGQRVLVRVDINVPIVDGRVTDDTRMKAIAPTVREILKKGGKPILLAHRGRPKSGRDPLLSLELLRLPLSEALDAPVTFGEYTGYRTAQQWAETQEPGEVLLLENVRFFQGEETNASEIVNSLAALGDIYVNDAFSVSHRAHASVCGIANQLPAVAGRLMEAELNALEKALTNPERPLVAIVGGAKISTKLDLLENLAKKVDYIVIGGGMANTFLAAMGKNVGKSLCEHGLLSKAREIILAAKKVGCEIVLPTDVVVAWEFEANARHQTVSVDDCPADAMILDAGPETVTNIKRLFNIANTIVWNGPLGAFEIPPFNTATDAAALSAADQASAGHALVVAGGGDTVAALNSSGAAEQFSYVSTAGGAFLEWLEGKTLPGVAALQSQNLEDA